MVDTSLPHLLFITILSDCYNLVIISIFKYEDIDARKCKWLAHNFTSIKQ